MQHLLMGCVIALLVACHQDKEPTSHSETLRTQRIPVPGEEGGAPNLFVTASGESWLSWVEYIDDTTDALLISQFVGERWAEPSEVARGSDWFVNWADFPSLALFKGVPGMMAAHWLQKSAGGTYDYDVHIALSHDNGQSWPKSFIIHTDGVAAEHGFVTLLPLDNGRIFATWLDGRNTKSDGAYGQGHNHSQGAAMTIRTAEFDIEGNLFEEAELDSRVCDCCQTDAAITSSGPVVVYRDRSDTEVRDISIVRKVDGDWTEPMIVYNDDWEIAGCPVNGPAIDAQGNDVVVAWYTVNEGESRVQIAFSTDAGKSFGTPIRIDDGRPLGRVDVVFLDEQTALISWLEQTDESGEIRLALVNNGGKEGESQIVTKCDNSRQSGFPKLAKSDGKFLLTWTLVGPIVTSVESIQLSL